jgi:hypothetical protein
LVDPCRLEFFKSKSLQAGDFVCTWDVLRILIKSHRGAEKGPVQHIREQIGAVDLRLFDRGLRKERRTPCALP